MKLFKSKYSNTLVGILPFVIKFAICFKITMDAMNKSAICSIYIALGQVATNKCVALDYI